MKILYVCQWPPCPARSGVQLRMLNVGRLLRASGDVTFALAPPWPLSEEGDLVPTEAEFSGMEWIPPPLRRPWGRRWEARLFGTPTAPSADRRRLRALAADHDVVWLHTLNLARRFRAASWAHERVVVDLDDLQHVKYAQRLHLATSLGERSAMAARWLQCRRWERRILASYAAAVVCSEKDRQILGGDPGIHVVPNGFEAPAEPPSFDPPPAAHLGFVGFMGYPPNLDALAWFAERILPSVRARMPGVRLRVIGRPPKTGMPRLPDAVDYLGSLEDCAAEMSGWRAAVVPMRVGGGTRLKILDAFSKGIPVVSTAIGAYGLGTRDGVELLLADDAEAFADACVRVLDDAALARALAAAGWDCFQSRFTWDRVAPNVEAVVRSVAG